MACLVKDTAFARRPSDGESFYLPGTRNPIPTAEGEEAEGGNREAHGTRSEHDLSGNPAKQGRARLPAETGATQDRPATTPMPPRVQNEQPEFEEDGHATAQAVVVAR